MIEQQSPEWFAARIGKVTASRISDVVARTKTGWGASRANYMAELVAEILTGVKYEGYVNAAMQFGIDTEPQARDAYAFYTDAEVDPAGFFLHPIIHESGASPDGVIGNEGLVEIKCPNTATHIETLLTGTIDKKYVLQMQWQMACTARKWCDFCSFDPRMPVSMQIFISRVHRDDKCIGDLEKDVIEFLKERDEKLTALRQKYESAEAA